jgi:cytochrome c oxidase accessory protein FixG
VAISGRVATVDENGRRTVVHPAEVRGKWRNRRVAVRFLLVVFFLAVPWIRIAGKPLLALDLPGRTLIVAGALFRAHDAPMLLLLSLTFLLGFALLTALYGRVWCGWACPQTVFIEGLFRRIERGVEGNAFERRKLAGRPVSERLGKLVVKWSLYLAAASLIAHSVLAFVLGPETLRAMIAEGPSASPAAFGFAMFVTALALADFGWFREQFCIFICPYGRIQSIFQDRATRTVTYDARRGEPRAKIRSKTPAFAPDALPAASGEFPPKSGDCVDCRRCVTACPTGIDIRNGSSQLECIACTACMDACDDVMFRLGRERGLIRYASEEEIAGEARPRSRLRGRALAYHALLAVSVGSLGFLLGGRKMAMVEIFKTRGEPFVELRDGDAAAPYANLFMAELSNQTGEPIEIELSLEGAGSLVMPNNPVRLAPGEYLRNPFTVRFAKSALSLGRGKAVVNVRSRSIAGAALERSEEKKQEVTLVGPF